MTTLYFLEKWKSISADGQRFSFSRRDPLFDPCHFLRPDPPRCQTFGQKLSAPRVFHSMHAILSPLVSPSRAQGAKKGKKPLRFPKRISCRQKPFHPCRRQRRRRRSLCRRHAPPTTVRKAFSFLLALALRKRQSGRRPRGKPLGPTCSPLLAVTGGKIGKYEEGARGFPPASFADDRSQ